MGAWGPNIFENDDACDFAGQVIADVDLTRLRSKLNDVLKDKDENLEAPEASEALAAADIVSRLRGSWGQRDAYTEALDEWVARSQIRPDNALISQAIRAVERVMTEPSELLELWSEGDASEFKQIVDDLSRRLRALGGGDTSDFAPTKPGIVTRLKGLFSK